MRHTDLLRRVPARLLGQARTTAAALDRHGWAEAGAGNLSLRLDAPLLAGPRYRLPMAAPHLCGTALLIKQGGAWMRDIARTPTEGLCLVQIDDRGESYTVRPANARPTSELASHVAAHNRLAACRPQDRAVLHTHPTDLVELTLLIPDRSELVRRLAGSGAARSRTLTDIVVAVPQARPGSKTLARTTAAVMRRSRGVIWPGHGMIATGTTLREALRIIELTNQAAAAVLGSGRSTLHAARLTPQASRVMRLEA